MGECTSFDTSFLDQVKELILEGTPVSTSTQDDEAREASTGET